MSPPAPFVALGGAWYLPPGVAVASGIELPAGTHVVIDGTLRLSPGATGSLLRVNGDSVLIEGAGTLDGDRGAQSVPTAGIDTGQVTHLRVRDLTITNFSGWPVNIINRSSDVRLAGLTMTASGAAPQFANGSSDCWASGLQVSGIDDYGFCFYGGVTNSGLSHSIFRDCKPGCGVLADDAQPGSCSDITIDGVHVYVSPTNVGNVEALYVVDNTTAGQSPPQFVKVTGCLFDGGSTLSGGQHGATGTFAALLGGQHNELTGCTFRNSRAQWSLEMLGAANVQSGNRFINCAGQVRG